MAGGAPTPLSEAHSLGVEEDPFFIERESPSALHESCDHLLIAASERPPMANSASAVVAEVVEHDTSLACNSEREPDAITGAAPVSQGVSENSTHQPVISSMASYRIEDGTSLEAEAASSFECEYDANWSVDRTSEMRVEVLSASNLGAPEYRFGDMATSLFGGRGLEGAQPETVYVELELGSTTHKTGCMESSGPSTLSFGSDNLPLLFVYRDEKVLRVRARDQRGVQALLRGDPLVGEANLVLAADLRDCRPRTAEVALQREGVAAGTITVRYQLLQLADGEVLARPSVAPLEGLEELHEDADFVTPPGSDR